LLFCERKWVSPRLYRGPPWLSPTVAPEPLRWYPLGTRRGWCLLMGHSSLLVVVAPEALQDRGCSCKVFSQSLPVCEVLVSAGVDNILAGLDGAVRAYLAHVCVQCTSRRCSRASSPRAWARSRLCLIHTPLRRPSAGHRGEASTTPVERVANYGFLIELLSGGSSGRPCPVR
jgi:hypothetical protein